MSLDYINEAFKRLEALNEDVFDTSLSGLNSLADFKDQDDASDIVKVIDPDAETEDAVSDSYIGKVIINCNVCHSHIFESKEDVIIDEDGVVNPEMQCPYCGETSGFTVVGEIKPFKQEQEASSEEKLVDEVTDEETLVTESDEKNLLEGVDFDTTTSEIDVLKDFLRAKGHPCTSKEAITYLWGVVDLFDAGNEELSLDNIANWYEETCRNFPEDLSVLNEEVSQNADANGVESDASAESVTEDNNDGNPTELEEGIFDKFKKKKPEVKPEEEKKPEEPKTEKEEFTTYSYEEWIQALEYGHKYYAEDGPEAGKTKLWDKAIEISACKNLAKDVTDCMDAWMKHEGKKNFPHKSYAKHLEEGLFGFGKNKKKSSGSNANKNSQSRKVTFKIYDGNGRLQFNKTFEELPGKMSAREQLRNEFTRSSVYNSFKRNSPSEWFYERVSDPPCSFDTKNKVGTQFLFDIGIRESFEEGDLNESIDELSLTANGTHIEVEEDENGKVTLVSEPVEDSSAASISPVSDETVDEITVNNDIEVEDPESEEEEEIEVDVDEVDEESLDELGEAYLKKIYENVESFKTTAVSTTDSEMIVEGIITFQSGVERKTGFVFEAYSASSDGQVKFIGKNEHFSLNTRAFSLTGKISNKKLLPESLTYNYHVGSRKIVGTVSKQ